MRKHLTVLIATGMLAVGGLAYGLTLSSNGCPLEGTPLCPKINCPLAGTPDCPYKLAACCVKK